ncbi:uncharacterized protein [Linepithema humile]|nr:PREDICTED: uncharacterized protein LOC105670823 isoform X2 [Linepithema humile]
MFKHPVLYTLLCSNCYEFYGDGNFEQGDDATDMFCRWCANGGNLYCCSYCSNTFCYRCIRRNFTALVRKKIEADERWKCFVCNPNDLYTMRAVCWALLQHVQTVTRILKNDKKMTPEEIEEKMNLDESTCCPRRSKRKRRRLDSNSEEEDETYTPKVNGIPVMYTKRKIKKIKPITYTSQITNPNGNVTKQLQTYSNQPIPIRPRPIALLSGQSFNQTEPLQTVINQKERTNSSDNIMVSSTNMMNSSASLSSRYNAGVLQKQTPSFRTTFMNAIASNAYMQPSTAMNTTHQIILPAQTSVPLQPQSQSQLQSQPVSYQSSQPISYQSSQSLQSPLNTMVSIPNSMSQYKSRILLPKQKESNLTLIPNIIELDSDSDDELKVVEQPNVSTANKNDNVDTSSNKVVPVALAWDDDIREEQPLRIMHATQKETSVGSFKETMLPHSRELDKLFSDVKEKVCSFYDLNDAIQDIELAAEQKMKQYYHNMCNTVLQLAHINDRVVREYNDWMRSRKTETDMPSSTDVNALTSRENIDISLDMTCVNDSDNESECEINQIKEPSDIVKSSNIVKNLLFYKKDVVHRGVGNDSVQFMDKTTQMYDVSRNYDKCISHCVLTKADQRSKADDTVLEPVAPDKNFGKYEEQFIFYLQHIEDHGIETEDMKGLDNSVEISLQEQIETNSPQLFENIASANQSTTYEQEINLRNGAAEDDKIDTPVNIDDKDKEIVDNSDFDIRIKDINILNDILQETESQKICSHTTDADADALVISNDDAMSSSKNINDAVNMETTASVGSEEDCTIIDD